ncbi:one cut domain family member 2-like, partial [Python bivittatus]|uniref:One cut domain family member 2-like n=1 Tax=Python bivittatus TaxID=176946 RepID=A0A9F2RFV6_PYTBI
NLYGPYKEMPGMGQSLSPLGNGLGSLHNPQQGLHNYGPAGPEKMLSPNFEAHPAMLARGEQHLSRGLATPPAPMMAHLNGMHVSNPGQLEEINTKEVAQRITAELKRYSIPQAIFAQRVLCRSQGTLSDLLRNPKPWSKLKSGRETFRRMWKWLQEPEFQRMSALRLAGKWLALGGKGGRPRPPTSRGDARGEGGSCSRAAGWRGGRPARADGRLGSSLGERPSERLNLAAYPVTLVSRVPLGMLTRQRLGGCPASRAFL